MEHEKHKEFYKKELGKMAKGDGTNKMRNVTPETYGMVAESKMPKKHYPMIDFKIADIPEAKKWEIGKTYTLQLEVKQHAIRADEHEGRVTFEIHKIKSV